MNEGGIYFINLVFSIEESIEIIVKVLRNGRRLVLELNGMRNEERREVLELPTSNVRRMWGDMMPLKNW